MAAGRVQWRRFAFFDRDVISENIKAKNVDSSITCAVAEGGTLVFGDAMGHIYIADRDLELGEVKHKVFRGEVKGVSYLLDAQHKRQFIVTAGNDSRPRTAADGTVIPNLNASYVVKIFNVADMSRPMNAFLAATGPENAHAVLTAFAVTPDATQIALGFSNRTILLYSGPFLKEGAMLRQVPPEVLFPPRNTLLPVTGLHFCELNNGGGSGGGSKGSSSSSSSQQEAGGNGNNSNRAADKLRRTRLFAVLDIDAAVAAAADANSAPDYFSEAGSDEEVRQLYPGVFGNPKTKNMHGLNDDGSPLSASDVMDLAEGGVFVFDTTVSVSYRGGTAMVQAPPGGRKAVTVLDDRGGGLHCSSLMKASSELLVGRAEGVFSYSVDDRGAAAGFEGDKQCIATVGSYVLVASSDLKSKRTGITAYDLRHKFIAMSSQLPGEERIRSVINDGGTCYILTSSHSLIRFREKNTATKLDLLVKKSLYPLAISLAAEERSSVSDIMRLYRQHADHCYTREEYESAALQYSYTIGYVPSSYVIRKFLEPTLVAHLVFYLERLQEKGLATNDHASVLLLAYAKTGDRDALKRFIYSCSNEPATTQYGAAGQLSRTAAVPMREAPAWGGGNKSVTTRVGESNAAAATGSSSSRNGSSSSSGGGGKKTSHSAAQEQAQAAEEALKASYAELGGFIDFQVEPCIEALRSNNYLDLALLLARTCDKHTSVVGLMLERVKAADSGSGGSGGDSTMGDSPSAELLRTLSEMALALPTDQLVEIAAVHGSALLALDADVITALFIKMCTGELDALRSASSSSSSSSDSNSNGSITTYYDNNDIERIVSVFGGGDHTGSLLMFMEAVLDHRKTDQRSGRHFSPRLSETLLELYLAEYSRRKTDFEASYNSHVPPKDADYPRRWPDKTRALQGKLQEEERRVMGALDGSHTDKYDAAHALLLAHNYGCEVAQRFLLERFESADLLLRKYMEAEDEKGIFRVLRREGKKDPDLYVQVLTYFVQQSLNVGGSKSGGAADDTGDNDDDDDDDEDDDEEGRWDAVAQVLSLVESESRIPHMKILHVLARNPELPLSVAKRFITRHIVQAREETEELESSTVATAATIDDLKHASGGKKKKKKKSKAQKQGNEPKLGAVGVIDGHDEDIDDFAEDNAARMRAGSGSMSGQGLGRDSDEDEEDDDEDDDEEDDSFGGSSMLSQRDRGILHETESAIEKEKWDRIKKLSLNRANEHEAFYAELEASEDGFGTVASAFGKTIMGGAV